MSKFNVGDKVKYINTDHDTIPDYYPPYGTIGVFKGNNWVQWPIGVTGGDGCWCCDESDIELVENVDMTDEEIWEMLESKMRKNGLKQFNSYEVSLLNMYGYDYNYYTTNDVHNAIAIAYRSGYERAIKGRPFVIGEMKKQGPHWEWIKPGEIVPDGTEVRYMKRATGDDGINPYYPNIGQECIKLNAPGSSDTGFWVQFEGSQHNFTCLDHSRDCFQKWVGDDE